MLTSFGENCLDWKETLYFSLSSQFNTFFDLHSPSELVMNLILFTSYYALLLVSLSCVEKCPEL